MPTIAAEREQLKAVLAHLRAGPALSDPGLPPPEVKRFREAIEQFLAQAA